MIHLPEPTAPQRVVDTIGVRWKVDGVSAKEYTVRKKERFRKINRKIVRKKNGYEKP